MEGRLRHEPDNAFSKPARCTGFYRPLVLHHDSYRTLPTSKGLAQNLYPYPTSRTRSGVHITIPHPTVFFPTHKRSRPVKRQRFLYSRTPPQFQNTLAGNTDQKTLIGIDADFTCWGVACSLSQQHRTGGQSLLEVTPPGHLQPSSKSCLLYNPPPVLRTVVAKIGSTAPQPIPSRFRVVCATICHTKIAHTVGPCHEGDAVPK